MTVTGDPSAETYYYLKDHQNAVIALTDDTGSIWVHFLRNVDHWFQ
jgi:hypothetical protein